MITFARPAATTSMKTTAVSHANIRAGLILRYNIGRQERKIEFGVRLLRPGLRGQRWILTVTPTQMPKHSTTAMKA